MSIEKNLEEINEQIKQACQKSDRNIDEITIIGVTKYVTIERTEQLLAAGIKDIGENRTDEMLNKYDKIGDRADWHFIGTLQSRKVREVVDQVTAIHSLERLSVARQINSRSSKPIDCFVQVNVSGEESKHGLEPEDVMPFIEELAQFDKVNVVGLMTMAPEITNQEEIRVVFRRLAQLRDEVMEKNYAHAPCEFLSMGMSNDFHIAIEEGATHVRIGSKLVGS